MSPYSGFNARRRIKFNLSVIMVAFIASFGRLDVVTPIAATNLPI